MYIYIEEFGTKTGPCGTPYLAIERRKGYMIEKSSVIAMSNDAGPYGWKFMEC